MSIVSQFRNPSSKFIIYMLVHQGLPEHSRPNQTRPCGTVLNVLFCTHSSERTLNVQGFWPTWRATNQHAPNTHRGQAKKASSAPNTFHPHLCRLEVLLNLSLLVDSKMIFGVSNALTCLVLTGISQFIPIQGASQSDATFECVCNSGFCLGWRETANPCKRRDRPLGQMNQLHLWSCWVTFCGNFNGF